MLTGSDGVAALRASTRPPTDTWLVHFAGHNEVPAILC